MKHPLPTHLLLAVLALVLMGSARAQDETADDDKKPAPFVIPPDANGMKTVIAPIVSQRPLKVAIFGDKGSSKNSVDVAINAVSLIPDATYAVLNGPAVGTANLNDYDVIVFAGGSGSAQSKSIGEAGLNNVREYVRGGGGYVGICAGAYLACSNFSWSLGILNARTVSSKWQRGQAIVKLETTEAAKPILGKSDNHFNVRYHNGPIMKPAERIDLPSYTPLTFFRSEVAEFGSPVGVMVNSPAQAIAPFGKGRVFVSSPHPENTPGLENLIPRGIVWASGQDLSVPTP